MQDLQQIQSSIQRVITSFQRSEQKSYLLNQTTAENNRKIFSVMRRIFQSNLIPLHVILSMLGDCDLFSMAATCKTLNRIIYSPFGFRILRTLRPLILQVKKIEEEPSLSVSMFDFSGGEKMGKDMRDDDDDLEAVIMMLNTNNLAMMQKIKQIDKAKKKYNAKSKSLMSTLNEQAKLKQSLQLKNQQRQDRIQKLQTVGKDNEGHIRSLIDQHNKLFAQRMHRLAGFERDRDKLLGQKELLVKKLKALMKEAEQQQQMSVEVVNIIKKIGGIVKRK